MRIVLFFILIAVGSITKAQDLNCSALTAIVNEAKNGWVDHTEKGKHYLYADVDFETPVKGRELKYMYSTRIVELQMPLGTNSPEKLSKSVRNCLTEFTETHPKIEQLSVEMFAFASEKKQCSVVVTVDKKENKLKLSISSNADEFNTITQRPEKRTVANSDFDDPPSWTIPDTEKNN